MPSQHKVPTVRVRLPEAVRARLLERVARTGEPVNKVISEAVAEKLERDEMSNREQTQPGACQYCQVAPSEGFAGGCEDPAGHGYCGHCRTCLLCGRYRVRTSAQNAVWDAAGRRAQVAEILADEDSEYAKLWQA